MDEITKDEVDGLLGSEPRQDNLGMSEVHAVMLAFYVDKKPRHQIRAELDLTSDRLERRLKRGERLILSKRKNKPTRGLDDPIDALELSVRASSGLDYLGIKTVGDLMKHTEAELFQIKNFGRGSLQEVVDLLSFHGLVLPGPALGEHGDLKSLIRVKFLRFMRTRDVTDLSRLLEFLGQG